MTDLSRLNEQQRDAVMASLNKNVVLLAGAGSGKTATMVTRTQYLVDDLGIDPSSIMLVTFTNKAAREILERISKVYPSASQMWIGTFHRICIRILRMHGDKLGIYHFTILDTKGQKEVIREYLEDVRNEHNYGAYLINSIIDTIGNFKNNMISSAQAMLDTDVPELYREAYRYYQNTCWQRRTFDFDDLIIYATLLLQRDESVRQWAHNKFKFIMADEVQDTNMSQFVFLNNIIGPNNVMLVGDVSQSIYGFRNAKPEYLENFADTHPNTIKMKLEKNYRSTKNIINAANNVVNHNSFGTKLEMFCDKGEGDKIQIYNASDTYSEAKWIISEILADSTRKLSDFAIIYRANYQSRIIEEMLVQAGVDYTVFGSQSFYSRKEVRDMLAWLKFCINPYDVDSFKRILGNIKGVGKVTINNIINYANTNMISLRDVVGEYLKSGSASRIKKQMENDLLIANNIFQGNYTSCSQIIERIFNETNIRSSLILLNTEDAKERLDILNEFQNMIHSREVDASNKNVSMIEIVDQVSLLSDAKTDADKSNVDCVKLMTAHASKGLEFNTVFIIGAQEGSFPHKNAIETCSFKAIEEERRLFYVAMTRAEEKLYITYTTNVKSNENGGIAHVAKSRFINEIPQYLTEEAF